MALAARALRSRFTAFHPEAHDWRNRVLSNGGTVSNAQTMNAISRFCYEIDAARLRDRFVRLSLMAGSDLNACLTPLYRGRSFGGTEYGNATDTNVGPFVSGDYTETGSSGGLVGNGTSKYLKTGVTPNDMPDIATGHTSSYVPSATATANRYHIGSFNLTHIYGHRQVLSTDAYAQGCWGAQNLFSNQFVGTTTLPGGLWMSERSSSTLLTYYLNGTSTKTLTTSTTPGAHSQEFYVFALNNNGSDSFRHNYGMRAYSIGLTMTATQVSAYYTAMQNFQTALSRNA